MEKINVDEILKFVKNCDNDFENHIFMQDNAKKATKYLLKLEEIKEKDRSNMEKALIDKLNIIIYQTDTMYYHNYKKEAILNIVSLSATDYIITLVKEKHLIDPLLIARFVYIELSKVLYYDISYVKQKNEAEKRQICDTSVSLEKEKVFSYVVCTQWLALYSYILNYFGIPVKRMNIEGQDHVWGEIELNDKEIVIVDATDYIDGSIDLSNAKSLSPTVGFVVLPKEYSGIKLYDVFNNPSDISTAKKIMNYYAYNRELDITLGYITKKGYKVDNILAKKEIFNYPKDIVTGTDEIEKFMMTTIEFFENLKVPNNMDGYEIFAYYSKFIKRLPMNIRGNIEQQTIYVDSFEYKYRNFRKKFLTAPREYLKYLDGLVYSRYYKYLSEAENNELLEQMRVGERNGKDVSKAIMQYEMKIAEINRRLNLFYAINKLHFYDPTTIETLRIQLYEPMMGTKLLSSTEELEVFKANSFIKKN